MAYLRAGTHSIDEMSIDVYVDIITPFILETVVKYNSSLKNSISVAVMIDNVDIKAILRYIDVAISYVFTKDDCTRIIRLMGGMRRYRNILQKHYRTEYDIYMTCHTRNTKISFTTACIIYHTIRNKHLSEINNNTK